MIRRVRYVVGCYINQVAYFASSPLAHIVHKASGAHRRAIADMKDIAADLCRDADPCMFCGSPGGTHMYRDDVLQCYLPNRLDYGQRVAREPQLRAELARREERGAA